MKTMIFEHFQKLRYVFANKLFIYKDTHTYNILLNVYMYIFILI